MLLGDTLPGLPSSGETVSWKPLSLVASPPRWSPLASVGRHCLRGGQDISAEGEEKCLSAGGNYEAVGSSAIWAGRPLLV